MMPGYEKKFGRITRAMDYPVHYDAYGRITRLKDWPVTYNASGHLTRAADYPVHYGSDGRISHLKGYPVHYDAYGCITMLGGWPVTHDHSFIEKESTVSEYGARTSMAALMTQHSPLISKKNDISATGSEASCCPCAIL